MLLSLHCATGKDFDQIVFMNEMKELGFKKIFRARYLACWKYGVLPMPDDILEDEMKVFGIMIEDFLIQ